ncbi:hypothetical protein ACIBHX_01540 [Nonomuraea sp. NPDC050536]|uniref:hypothetical protein n=1 Tax=Nonomuraea sp. NPDC050536 TaxID=3364366 RepID=UPI0037CBECED
MISRLITPNLFGMAPQQRPREHNGPAMRAIRRRSELSVQDLCRLLKEEEDLVIHPNHIRNIETNARGASDKVIGAIARVLRVKKVVLMAAPEAADQELESA